ncbi:MAG: hypothetical protein JWQ94_4941 [Tardiphaga sp.]|nr:hypothetical protein [Tardiphaga sp.]
MVPGPERPDAQRVIVRSPGTMDWEIGVRVVRFPGEQLQFGNDGGGTQRTGACAKAQRRFYDIHPSRAV